MKPPKHPAGLPTPPSTGERHSALNPVPVAHPLFGRLFAPVDIASLVCFRVFFGLMMLWTIWGLHAKDLIASLYVEPPFHFTYYGFEWLRPWPGHGMYWHFAALALLSLFVAAGFCYRVSALLLFLGFTYVFLLEKAVYLNHHYLMCLICLALGVVPAHRAWSVDAWLRPSIRSESVPAWALWLLRFHIALPYVFGGIAKLQADWLRGQPMQLWLSVSPLRILIGPVMEEHWVALLFSYAGLLFDLAVVPLLLWQQTRRAAFVVAVLFHLLNALNYDIGVFPWLMIGATTLFLAPDWPRHVIDNERSFTFGGQRRPSGPALTSAKPPSTPSQKPLPTPLWQQRVVAGLLIAYATVHVLVPLRHWLYPGNVLWTEEGYLFSWHMMARAKVNAVRFVVVDRASGKTRPGELRWLSAKQVDSLGYDPDMMREYAHYLRSKHEQAGRDVEVRVVALSSLNGRKPQHLVDPSVDLSREPARLGHQPYVVPLTEPFRWEPWDVPVPEWEKVLSEKGR